jgi:hypothetical protein
MIKALNIHRGTRDRLILERASKCNVAMDNAEKHFCYRNAWPNYRYDRI